MSTEDAKSHMSLYAELSNHLFTSLVPFRNVPLLCASRQNKVHSRKEVEGKAWSLGCRQLHRQDKVHSRKEGEGRDGDWAVVSCRHLVLGQ